MILLSAFSLYFFRFLLAQLDPKLQDNIHIFSSFFYRRLSSAKLSLSPSSSSDIKSGFDLVKSWTRKVNLFEKDFIIVPICENLHWFLAIICYPSKMLAELIEDDDKGDLKETEPFDMNPDDVNISNNTFTTVNANVDINLSQESLPFVDLDPEPLESTKIFIFDSLGLASRGKGIAVINRLRTYLQLEAQDKLKRGSSKSACTGHIVKVPQQENYTDCGCFLLQFAEEFIRDIPKDIVNKIQEQSHDLSQWFPSSLAQSRREIMRKRVKQLAQDYSDREKLKNDSKSPEEQHEDRSSDIEEIIMLPSK
jgi:sentrin-specific protease 7